MVSQDGHDGLGCAIDRAADVFTHLQARVRELESVVAMLVVKHGQSNGHVYRLTLDLDEAHRMRAAIGSVDPVVILTLEGDEYQIHAL